MVLNDFHWRTTYTWIEVSMDGRTIYTGLFINNLTLSKFYCKKTDDATGTCSVSSDRPTSATRSEGGAGKDHEWSRIDHNGRPGESVWWTRIQNWRVQGHTRCSHWEFIGLKQNFESFCIQWYAICLNYINSLLEIKKFKSVLLFMNSHVCSLTTDTKDLQSKSRQYFWASTTQRLIFSIGL
jgi:hypothetical protein